MDNVRHLRHPGNSEYIYSPLDFQKLYQQVLPRALKSNKTKLSHVSSKD